MKRNGYLTFQMIIDITGACGTPLLSFDTVCVGSPVVIIIHAKSQQTSTEKILKFSTRVGTIAHQ